MSTLLFIDLVIFLMYHLIHGGDTMSLGQRVQTILKERKIKQVEFARTLGISANYVNLIVNNKKETISDTLAKLIEESYGYSAQWVLNGSGEKLSSNELTAEKYEIIKKIQKMSTNEIKAVLAFVNTLDSMKENGG